VADPGFYFRVCRQKIFIYNSVKLFDNSVKNYNISNVIRYTSLNDTISVKFEY
jgi:hypothetical protein